MGWICSGYAWEFKNDNFGGFLEPAKWWIGRFEILRHFVLFQNGGVLPRCGCYLGSVF